MKWIIFNQSFCRGLCLLSLFWATSGAAWAGAYEDYRSLDLKLAQFESKNAQGTRQTDREALRQAIDVFSQRYAKGHRDERTMAAHLVLRMSLVTEDYRKALGAVKTLLDLKPTPEQQVGLLKLATQLAYQSRDYAAVAPYADRWKAVVGQIDTRSKREEAAQLWTLAAYALHELKTDRVALSRAREAYAWAPQKARGDFILALCAHLGDEKAERDFLPTMVRDWPDRVYWNRWGYLEYVAGHEKKALNVLSSADKANQLDERLVPLLVSLTLSQEAPTKAVALVEKYPRAWSQDERDTLLVSLWIKAGDRAKARDYLKSRRGHAREALALELAFASEDWSVAQAGAARLVQSSKTPKDRDRWRYFESLSRYYLKDYQGASSVLQAMETSQWQQLAQPWIAECAFFLK